MLSIRNILALFLVPLLLVVFTVPAEAQRGGQRRSAPRMQRKAPQMRTAPRARVQRSMPRPQVRRSAPRQMRRSAPRQVRRSAPTRQVTRSAPRANRSAPRANRSAPRANNPRQQQRRQATSKPHNSNRINRPSRNNEQRVNRGSRSRYTRGPSQVDKRDRQMTRRPRTDKSDRPANGNDRRWSRGPESDNPGRRNDRRWSNGPQNDHRHNTRRDNRKDRRMTRGPQNDDRGKYTRRPNTNEGNRNRRRYNYDTQATAVRRPVRNTNVNTNTNVNVNNAYSQPVYNQPVYANNPPIVYNNNAYCPPTFYNDFYSPVIYNDYWVRRRYRRFNNCANVFLSLGFFLSRPYSYYDYATVGYTNPIIYGDDNYYRPPSAEGGPEPDAVTADTTVAAAPTQPATLNSPEERMLSEVAGYVEERSMEGRYRVTDAAFSNQVWLLDLAQAPAVFEIKDGLYSVVAGFEGTLGTSNVPSNVNVEFFVAKTANGYEVRDAWITSANGIARNKLYQSPVFPDVRTWEAGKKCPFTGQPMIPIPPTESSEHG